MGKSKRASRRNRRLFHKRPVVVIATPMLDDCKSAFAVCLVDLVATTLTNHKDADCTFLTYGTSILPFSRNILARKSMELNATHMLWIDSDMTFPADTILRMLAHDKKIVGGRVRFVLLRSIGEVVVTDDVDLSRVEQVLSGDQ